MFFNIDNLLSLRSALFSAGFRKFNEDIWGYKSEPVSYSLPGKERPVLEGILYLTKNGKVKLPPYNPYLPFQFCPTLTQKNCQLYPQWLSVAKLLAEDIRKRGISGSIAFPPGFVDARPFNWLGSNTTFGYTFIGQLPCNDDELDTSVRKNTRKAMKYGYTCVRTNDWDAVAHCLKMTSDYKNFDTLLSSSDLAHCEQLLGDDILFAHIGLSPSGEPVSAQVKLAMPGGICIDWLAGTDRSHINSGINQYLYSTALNDIAQTGTLYFDYCGANIESVARAKSAWGFSLTPYLTVLDNSWLPKMKCAVDHIRGARRLYHYIRRHF